MDLRTKAVAQTSFLHLRDAEDNLLYEQKTEDIDGVPTQVDDLEKPIGITQYSPGSKPYARAQAARQNKAMDRYKKKGKSDQSPEEMLKETAEFLTATTKSFHYIERDKLEGDALFMAVYMDMETGFIAEQANKNLGEWGNFMKGSPKP